MNWPDELKSVCPHIELRYSEPLSKHVSMRVGGPAAVMAFPKSEEALAELLQFCRSRDISPLILGAGTNLLPPDAGLNTLAISLYGGLSVLRLLPGHIVEAGAGVPLSKAAVFAQEHGLTGLEFAHGIPGTVGGGLFMNAGAYGGEMSQVAVETDVMDYDGQIVTLSGTEQSFGYRASAFQSMECVIVKSRFRLAPGDPVKILTRMRDLQQKRRQSQPLNVPSSGSTFKRPAAGYAAALIEQAGLKGLRVGGASVSTKHAGFIVNDQNALCADVLALIAEVQEKVCAHSGIRLEPEVRILTDSPGEKATP